ncbi:hypothetical protein FDECE_1258 [Fusarium decemcellulare]|nr:hypothetical protein FDECE_1258 [Fusarium decemcellulare]
MEFAPIKPELRIESWRKRVPSRVERQDPFEGDGFDERPSTRLTFHNQSPPRSSTRLSFLRSATPLFMRPSTPSSRPASSMTGRPAGGKRKSLLGLFNLKRKRDSSEMESVPRDPIRLKFLFVGSKAAGQTSLLYHARYGYFPDASPLSNPQRIGAHRYLECSAVTGEGMKEVFDDSGREAMRRALGGGEMQEEETAAPKKKRRFF